MILEHSSTYPITVTEQAKARITELLSLEGDGAMFKISVSGGGCSGFRYNYLVVNERESDDVSINIGAYTLLIDQISLDNFMSGAVIDYVNELGNAYFDIKNPNSVAKCGCGVSFSI